MSWRAEKEEMEQLIHLHQSFQTQRYKARHAMRLQFGHGAFTLKALNHAPGAGHLL